MSGSGRHRDMGSVGSEIKGDVWTDICEHLTQRER